LTAADLRTRLPIFLLTAADLRTRLPIFESAKVFVNGKLSGQFDIGPSGWNKPFFIDVSDQAVPGKENLIAIRVVDTKNAGGLWKPVKIVTFK